jgi:hypothetical protein
LIANLVIALPQWREQKRATLDLIGGKDKHCHSRRPFHFARARENPGGARANNSVGSSHTSEGLNQLMLVSGMPNGEESHGDIGAGDTRLRHCPFSGFFCRTLCRNVCRLSDASPKHLSLHDMKVIRKSSRRMSEIAFVHAICAFDH